jgi:hypothetical protein
LAGRSEAIAAVPVRKRVRSTLAADDKDRVPAWKPEYPSDGVRCGFNPPAPTSPEGNLPPSLRPNLTRPEPLQYKVRKGRAGHGKPWDARQGIERPHLAHQRRSGLLSFRGADALSSTAKDARKEIWLTNMPPERSTCMLAALSPMRWRFPTFDEYPAFLSSDNPLFSLCRQGHRKARVGSYFSYIEPRHFVRHFWGLDLRGAYRSANSQVARELNARTCGIPTRSASNSQREDWVL